MKNNELLSIIIPVYNVEKYLEKCIDSIINQTYTNLEIILVDDGSTDNCGNICDEYAKKDNRIKLIHKENGGTSDARNEGLKISTGEYIGFVDSDDYIEPNMYEEMINNIKKNNADIVICSYNNTNNKKRQRKVNKKRYSYINNDEIEIINKEEAVSKLFFDDSCRGFLWNKLYKRDMLYNDKKLILFDDNIKILEDLLYNYIVFQNADRVVFNHNRFYNYVQREDSALHLGYSLTNKTFFYLMALDKLIQTVNDEKIRDKLKRDYCTEATYVYYYLTKYSTINKDTTDKLKKAKKKYKKDIQNSKYLKASKKIKTTLCYYFPPILYYIYNLKNSKIKVHIKY